MAGHSHSKSGIASLLVEVVSRALGWKAGGEDDLLAGAWCGDHCWILHPETVAEERLWLIRELDAHTEKVPRQARRIYSTPNEDMLDMPEVLPKSQVPNI